MAAPRKHLWLIVESSVDVRLVEGLAALFDLTVIARRLEHGTEISQQPFAPVRVERAGPTHARFAWHVFVRLLAERHRIDLVLAQNYGLAALASNLAGRLTRIPTVMQVCSPVEEYYRCRRVDRSTAKRFRRVELMALALIARVNDFVGQRYVVLSDHLASAVQAHGGRRPVHVCPVYGVDTELFVPRRSSKAEIRRSLGLPERTSLVFFSSRIAPEKDVDTLLKAIRLITEQGRDVTLLNASGGHLELSRLAHTYGVAEHLIARPAVDPRSELPRYYQASDVCVQASRAEGLGFSPLEALSCAIPVVAADVGGLRETIVDGSTGWTYHPGDPASLADALAGALDDPEEAFVRAESGRQLVAARFERQAVFSKFAEILDHAGAGGSNERPEVALEHGR